MSNGIIPGFLVQNLLYLLYQETDLVEQRKPANITKQYWTNLTIDFLFLFQKIVICVSPAWETTGNFRQARQTGHMRFFLCVFKGLYQAGPMTFKDLPSLKELPTSKTWRDTTNLFSMLC